MAERTSLVSDLKCAKFHHLSKIGHIVPAMGYGTAQIRDQEAMLAATPIDLTRILKAKLPNMRVRYELQIIGTPTLHDLLQTRLNKWAER